MYLQFSSGAQALSYNSGDDFTYFDGTIDTPNQSCFILSLGFRLSGLVDGTPFSVTRSVPGGNGTWLFRGQGPGDFSSQVIVFEGIAVVDEHLASNLAGN